MRRAIIMWNNKIVFYFSKYFVGIILLLAALGKFLDIPAYQEIIKTYDLAPEFIIPFSSYFFPVLETIIGVSILANYKMELGAKLSIALHALFAVVMTIELLRGLELPNCGCFGVFFGRPLTWLSPMEDLLMIYLSTYILKYKK